MDGRAFDRFSRAFGTSGSRRVLLGLLTALPLAGFRPDDAGTAGRRQRRKKRHKHQQGDGKDQRKGK